MARLPTACALLAALCGCDPPGVVHLVRYPGGQVKEMWKESGPPGGKTLRDGTFQSFHPDGRRESLLEYAGGLKQGKADVWDKQGVLIFRGKYRDDFLVRETRFEGSGAEALDRKYRVREEKVKAVGPEGDSLDAKEACAYAKRAKGSAAETGETRHGLCRMTYADGAILSTRYYSLGRLHGAVQAWHPGGSRWMEGAYDNGRPSGTWRTWWASGKPASAGAFANGMRQGPWMEYFPGGKAKSESRFISGRREGLGKEWYPNGRLRLQAAYRNGLKEGEEKAWYPDGSRLYLAGYRAGKLNGEFRQWYPGGGRMRMQCAFVKGGKEGVSRVWARRGGLLEQADYRAGRLHGTYRSWDGRGRPMASKEFREGALAYDSRAEELLELLGVNAAAEAVNVPMGLLGFYWGMERGECQANLPLLQATAIHSEEGGLSARILAFADRRPTQARLRLHFNPQGELWGIGLELHQEGERDFFPLCEALEAELGAGLGTAGLRKVEEGSPYRMTRAREWGRFTVASGIPPVRRELPVVTAEAFSPGSAGWFRFSLANNLYREYVNPENTAVTPPAWERKETFLAGR